MFQKQTLIFKHTGGLVASLLLLLLLLQVRSEGVGRHTVLGTTIDDSMGEAFDKVARLLGISAIPGGQTGCVCASDV
jgi:hypothetical protein